MATLLTGRPLARVPSFSLWTEDIASEALWFPQKGHVHNRWSDDSLTGSANPPRSFTRKHFRKNFPFQQGYSRHIAVVTASADKTARLRAESADRGADVSATNEIVCPHCGLTLRVKDSPAGSILSYDNDEWKRRCKFPQHSSPAWCFTEPKTGQKLT